MEKAIDDAFRVWSSVTPLNFQRVSRDQADVIVSFNTLDHSDDYPFDGTGKITLSTSGLGPMSMKAKLWVDVERAIFSQKTP